MFRISFLVAAIVVSACTTTVRERSFQDGDQWCTERAQVEWPTGRVLGATLYCEPLDGELEVR